MTLPYYTEGESRKLNLPYTNLHWVLSRVSVIQVSSCLPNPLRRFRDGFRRVNDYLTGSNGKKRRSVRKLVGSRPKHSKLVPEAGEDITIMAGKDVMLLQG